MVYALTNYKAMNGFRVINEMVELFEQAYPVLFLFQTIYSHFK